MTLQFQPEDVIRVPIIGAPFARIIATASGSTAASGIIAIGVVGNMIVGQTVSSTKDQRYVNCFPEKIKNPFTGEERYFITKRPGWATNTTPATGSQGSAIHIWVGQGGGTSIISAFGLTNGTVYNGTASIGTLTGVVTSINDTLIGTTANLLITTDGNKGYYYPDGGAMTEITDVDFPSNASQTIVGEFVPLNGYNFIMTTSGRIYNSDLNSIANWDSLSWLSSNIKSDQGLGLARYKNYIVAFGKESIEFFKVVQNATGSVLQPVQDNTINIGCISQYGFKEMWDTLVFIGSTAASGIGVYILDGLNARKISTSTIDGILSSTNVSGLFANVFNLVGKTFLAIVSNSDARTYVYGLDDDLWHEWTSGTILWTHITGIGTGTRYIYAVSRGSTSGKVYVINPTSFVFQDDGSNYTVTIQTSKFDGGTQYRKFVPKMFIVGDTYSSTNNISLSWSDDDYVTFSTARTVDLSADNAYVLGCGSFVRRAWRIIQSNSMPLRLEAFEWAIKQGIH